VYAENLEKTWQEKQERFTQRTKCKRLMCKTLRSSSLISMFYVYVPTIYNYYVFYQVYRAAEIVLTDNIVISFFLCTTAARFLMMMSVDFVIYFKVISAYSSI